MAAGAGGEAVVVFFHLSGSGMCEANIPGRTYCGIPSGEHMADRKNILDRTHTPWIDWPNEVHPSNLHGFGHEVPW
jgi:hypothetical protein